MTTADPIVIVGAARTPMGGFLGDFKDVGAPALGARAISAVVERAGIEADTVDEILMGCVLPAFTQTGAISQAKSPFLIAWFARSSELNA